MTVLEAVQVLNALLALGMNGLPVAQRVGKVVEKSVKAGNSTIPASDWEWAMQAADNADKNLKQALKNN